MNLTVYLRETAGRRFEWGRCDCVTFVCDWIVSQRGVDPAEPFRGQYASGLKAAENLAPNGGLAGSVAKYFERAGLKITDKPVAGDVGVVLLRRPTCAIYLGRNMWAAKGRRGVTISVAKPLAAWSVG